MIDKKIMQQAKDFRTAYDRGDFRRADAITAEVLADPNVPTWLWDSAIRTVKRCGIYNAYYITENCPYCNPELVKEEETV